MSGYSNGDAIRRLLKALSDGRELITGAYNAGGALPAGTDPDDPKLLSLRLFRVFTETPDGYLLSPGLGEVIATALREDRSGYIDTAFEKRLTDAEEYAARAVRHRKEGRYADADIALKSLKDAVRSIDYGVRRTVERLDLRITNRFGFVTSLDDKIATASTSPEGSSPRSLRGSRCSSWCSAARSGRPECSGASPGGSGKITALR